MNRLVRNYKLSIDFSFVNFTILPSNLKNLALLFDSAKLPFIQQRSFGNQILEWQKVCMHFRIDTKQTLIFITCRKTHHRD